MGTGIWSMHYIGMLAFVLPIPVAYHWPTVLLSLFAAILASVIALHVVSRQRMHASRAVAGRSARRNCLRWKVKRGFARRLWSHARVRRLGMPEMYRWPSKLWNTISIRRGTPVRRPVVVMSIVWPWRRTRPIAASSSGVLGVVELMGLIVDSVVIAGNGSWLVIS